ncbi:MAG: hypothetical protein JJU29_01730 [Verrucomicrobia bacterium]|nr:hypothetical protein [Verrucomicrobiota bacterium]MCH8510953.1 hypothetical protein [Kiritimatiellia bacterium]
MQDSPELFYFTRNMRADLKESLDKLLESKGARYLTDPIIKMKPANTRRVVIAHKSALLDAMGQDAQAMLGSIDCDLLILLVEGFPGCIVENDDDVCSTMNTVRWRAGSEYVRDHVDNLILFLTKSGELRQLNPSGWLPKNPFNLLGLYILCQGYLAVLANQPDSNLNLSRLQAWACSDISYSDSQMKEVQSPSYWSIWGADDPFDVLRTEWDCSGTSEPFSIVSGLMTLIKEKESISDHNLVIKVHDTIQTVLKVAHEKRMAD